MLADDILKTIDEIALVINESKRATYHKVATGQIPTFKVGGTIYARRSELEARFSSTAPKILLAEANPTGFDVVVLPTPAGVGHDRHFGDRDAALTYAERLGFAMGWEVRDRTDASAL